MTTSNIYTCELCGKILANKKTLRNHIARHEAVLDETKRSCKFCNRISKNAMAHSQHERLCKENKSKPDVTSTVKKIKTKLYTCRFCNIAFYKKELPKHEIWCDENPNLDFVKEFYASGKKNPNQYIKAKMLGLPKPELTDAQRQNISNASASQKWSEERRKKHSESMKCAVLKHPESYSTSNRGRVKQIKKHGLTFDGSWEVTFYEWCLKNNISVKDNLKYFPYTYNGKEHLYNPDFYLPDYNIYVEVKGYYDDKDLAKWRCFSENLYVLKAAEIDLINKDEFKLEEIIKEVAN